MRFKYLVSFWLVCSLFSCQDEKLVLSGTVLDAKDQQQIHQATILIKHKDSIDYPEHYLVATTSDSLGQFSFELEGSLNDKFLWIGYLGYEILEIDNLDSALKQDVFILNRDTSRHIDYIPSLPNQTSIDYSKPLNLILEQAKSLDYEKFYFTYQIRDITQEDLILSLDYYTNQKLHKEIEGYQTGKVLDDAFIISDKNQLFFTRSQESKTGKAEYQFDILKPLIIDETTLCVFYNQLIKYGERAGGTSSIAVFRFQNGDWNKMIDYVTGEL